MRIERHTQGALPQRSAALAAWQHRQPHTIGCVPTITLLAQPWASSKQQATRCTAAHGCRPQAQAPQAAQPLGTKAQLACFCLCPPPVLCILGDDLDRVQHRLQLLLEHVARVGHDGQAHDAGGRLSASGGDQAGPGGAAGRAQAQRRQHGRQGPQQRGSHGWRALLGHRRCVWGAGQRRGRRKGAGLEPGSGVGAGCRLRAAGTALADRIATMCTRAAAMDGMLGPAGQGAK